MDNNPLEGIIEILKRKDELSLAESLLDSFFKDSSKLQEFDLLGKLYHDIKSYQKSIASTEKSLLLASKTEERYSCRSNLIKLYNHTNQPEKALRYIKANQEIRDFNLDMEMEKVFSYFLLNQKDKSEAILRDLLETHICEMNQNTISRLLFNLGTYDLYKGAFKKGLRGFLLEGKNIGIWGKQNIPEKLLVNDINPLQENDNLLIFAEGGIGDEIINIRFMNILKERNINATWYTHRKDLANIFNKNGFNAVNTFNISDYNKVCYSMSLPIWLDISEEELTKEPYLFPENIIPEFMKSDKMKIGIRWSGNPYYEQDLHRSLNFKELYDTVKSKHPEAEIYSLQYPKDNIIDSYPEIIDCSKYINSYEDTIEILNNLDLVISSCTSVVHASAALGKEVITLVPISAYYTWCSPDPRGKDKSIWYGDNCTILRQENHDSWESVYEELKEKLDAGYTKNNKK